MLIIRLARTGRRNQPSYRIVVAENSRQPKGKFIQIVGWYNPVRKDKPFEVNEEAIKSWIAKGAQVSNTVAEFLNKNKDFKLPVHQKFGKPKKEVKEEPKVAPVAEKPAEPAETPITEEAPVVTEEATVETAPAEEVVAEVTPEAEQIEETKTEEAPVEEETKAE